MQEILLYARNIALCKKYCKDKAEICNLSIFEPKDPDLLTLVLRFDKRWRCRRGRFNFR